MNKPNRDASSLAPLLIFVIFTACILTVLLTGADVYRTLSQRDQDSFRQRTAARYLTTRIRQSDADRHIYVGDFNDTPADYQTDSGDSAIDTGNTLFLQEEISGRVFVTRIYCHDGQLQELFSLADLAFEPTAGEQILPMEELSFTLEDDLLTIRFTLEGTPQILTLHLRSGKEVTP